MEKDTLLIDGLCALCTTSGRFVERRRSKELEIIEQDSSYGQKILKKHNLSINSVVLIRKNKPFTKSSAAIRCLLYMRWNWRWMYPFLWLIPYPLRDIFYKLISTLRFRET